MKKMDIGIVDFINLKIELLNRYGVNLKARNYVFKDNYDPYFILDRKPNREVFDFIWDYFAKMDGLVMFGEDSRIFCVFG